jgi:hypothetical protein
MAKSRKAPTLSPEVIDQKIYMIRDEKVLLSHDLAQLYEVPVKVLNQAVKRNIERFPKDFMFQLSQGEFGILKSQFVTSSWGGARTPPYAFTEQGVAMLSSVLRSPRAIHVNIEIMRSFVRLRSMLATHEELHKKLASLEKKYDDQFKVVFEAIRQLMSPDRRASRTIGFKIDNRV